MPKTFILVVVKVSKDIPNRGQGLLYVLQVLAKRSIGLKGCEASLKAFTDSGLIDRLAQVHRDALSIYDCLKGLCQQCGHTYLLNRYFQKSKHFIDHPVHSFKQGYEFLEQHGVIKVEKKQGALRLYLHRYWFAECSIATDLGRLWNNHAEKPWKFDIDYSE